MENTCVLDNLGMIFLIFVCRRLLLGYVISEICDRMDRRDLHCGLSDQQSK